MNTAHAIEIPAAAMAALRRYAAGRTGTAGQVQIDALCNSDRPLTRGERRAPEEALGWWAGQQAAAKARITEITARLARG